MISNWKANDLFACKWLQAPATNQLKGHIPVIHLSTAINRRKM